MTISFSSILIVYRVLEAFSLNATLIFTLIIIIIIIINGWLEDREQQFFYIGIRALEKRRARCILVA